VAGRGGGAVMAVVRPPVELALARAQPWVPASTAERRWVFEPKFDGWRAVLFSTEGILQSRRGTDLTARFPELVRAAHGVGDVVLDGEIVALRDGRLDFSALATSPGTRPAAGVAVYYVAFDLLAENWRDWRPESYTMRRAALTRVMAGQVPPLQLTPSTTDRAAAMAWMPTEASAVGIEGCVAKRADSPYVAGRSPSWVKVRRMVVADAVIVGVTGSPRHPTEVVLARPDGGQLRRIGLSLPLAPRLREQIGQRVRLTGEPAVQVSTGIFGQHGHTEYRPTVPELVVEVEAEGAVVEFTHRLRPRVHRMRSDLTPNDLTP
jgi:ATP-dependent DNA ligase